MARITVEDCLEVVQNRFSLVLVAAERSKQLLKGAQPTIDNLEGNKEIVTALREIAARKFTIDDSSVAGDDRWLPSHRQKEGALVDDELPPEA